MVENRSLSQKLDWAVYITFFAVVLCLPLVTDDVFWLNRISKYLVFGLLGLAIALSWGYAGVLNLGQGLFFGLGAYMFAMSLKLKSGTSLQQGSDKPVPDFMVWNAEPGSPTELCCIVPGSWLWLPFQSQTFGMIMAVVTIALFILWISTDSLRVNLGVILLIIGIGWMLVASFFLYKLLVSTEKIDKLRDDYKLGEETIETPDGLTDDTPILKSTKYNLAGRPDFIIKKDEDRIPVEIKTGRPPKAPFFSHVLQIGAYCLPVSYTHLTLPTNREV